MSDISPRIRINGVPFYDLTVDYLCYFYKQQPVDHKPEVEE